jgi:hypothetical protein
VPDGYALVVHVGVEGRAGRRGAAGLVLVVRLPRVKRGVPVVKCALFDLDERVRVEVPFSERNRIDESTKKGHPDARAAHRPRHPGRWPQTGGQRTTSQHLSSSCTARGRCRCRVAQSQQRWRGGGSSRWGRHRMHRPRGRHRMHRPRGRHRVHGLRHQVSRPRHRWQGLGVDGVRRGRGRGARQAAPRRRCAAYTACSRRPLTRSAIVITTATRGASGGLGAISLIADLMF